MKANNPRKAMTGTILMCPWSRIGVRITGSVCRFILPQVLILTLFGCFVPVASFAQFDIQAKAITFDPSPILAGTKPTNYTFGYDYVGSIHSGHYFFTLVTEFFLSSDTIFSEAEDIFLGRDSENLGIPPSQTFYSSTTDAPNGLAEVNIPLISAGEYYVFIRFRVDTPEFYDAAPGNNIAMSTVRINVLSPTTLPSITVHPTNTVVSAGATARFTIRAFGAPPLDYYWQSNGTFMVGETASSLSLSNVGPSASGSHFSCIVSNAYGLVESASALLTVLPPTIDHFTWTIATSTPKVGIPFGVSLAAFSSNNVPVTDFKGPVAITGLGVSQDLLFHADFENEELSGWTNDGDGYTRNIVTNIAVAGTRSLTLIGGGLFNGISHVLSNIQPTHVTFYVRASTANSAGGYFVLGTGPDPSQMVVFFRMGSGGKMGIFEEKGGWYEVPYTELRWYKVGLILDWGVKRLDLYVDDTLAYADIPFRSETVNSLSRLWLCNYFSTQVWYDGIDLRGNPPLPVITDPSNSGIFVNGIWKESIKISQPATEVFLLASDNAGHTGSSSPFAVEHSQLRFTDLLLSQNGSLHMNLNGRPGEVYHVLISTNLSNWMWITTVSNSTGLVQFTDPGTAGTDRRFYRAVSQ